MIPLKDDNPSSTVPVVNIFLIITNVAVFIHLNYLAPFTSHSLVIRLGFIPYELSHFTDIYPQNLVPVPVTIITAMFLCTGGGSICSAICSTFGFLVIILRTCWGI